METDPTPLRKTKSVVRRALCDILRPVLRDVRILELFAGTGQVSEALIDEGARESVAVDLRVKPEQIPTTINWHTQTVESFLSNDESGPFGLIFLDPPYESGRARELLPRLAQPEWLSESGLIAVETSEDVSLPDRLEIDRPVYLMRRRRYGGSRLWIYQEGRDQPGYQE